MKIAVPPRSSAILAALLLAAPAAQAEITPEAKAVVERYITASGGHAVFDTLRGIQLDAHVQAIGLNGTTTTWAERPNRRASRTQLGPFNIPEGFDGTTGWRADPSGQVLTLDGLDLEDARAAAWFENLMWVGADGGGGRITVVKDVPDAKGHTVLEIAAPVGRAATGSTMPPGSSIARTSATTSRTSPARSATTAGSAGGSCRSRASRRSRACPRTTSSSPSTP
jgi:hypothetical protein